MGEWKRPLHRRVARILALMDAKFLEQAQCFFGGGTQLVMSHGEFRESRDIDLLLSSQDGLRMLRETIGERSLGRVFKGRIHLAREVRADRTAIRTFITEDPAAEPLKLEIVVEARIELKGGMDRALGVPCLAPPWAIAEKLLANADRGRAREYRARDMIDLAFVSLNTDKAAFIRGYELAEPAYGQVVVRELDEVLKMLDLDSKYRAQCVADLLITDLKALSKGVEKLHQLRRVLRKHARRAAKA
jgi:nucleotidyltransferase AbiEii toxin of type IV toxin-antitoxin system